MKLTPWFSGKTKPVRVGVYERNYSEFPFHSLNYCYWNGKFWGLWATTPRGAVVLKIRPSPYQNLPWRGVMK